MCDSYYVGYWHCLSCLCVVCFERELSGYVRWFICLMMHTVSVMCSGVVVVMCSVCFVMQMLKVDVKCAASYV